MKKQNVAGEKLEGLLWEKSKKYARGEINAKELKNALSSHSEATEKISINIRYVLITIAVLCAIVGMILYVMTEESTILLILVVVITPLTAQIISYYFKRRKGH